MRRRTDRVAITVTVSAAVMLVVGLTTVALASSHISASDQGDGIAAGKFNLNIAGFINFHTKGDLHVIDQNITVQPGGIIGWHSHPGPVLVVVKSGTFRTVQPDCSPPKDYPAGSVYVDEGAGHVHNALNPSASVPLVLSITYLLPPGVPRRTDATGNCPLGPPIT